MFHPIGIVVLNRPPPFFFSFEIFCQFLIGLGLLVCLWSVPFRYTIDKLAYVAWRETVLSTDEIGVQLPLY